MAIIVPDTGTGPIHQWSAADLAINARPSLIRRLKGRSHLYADPLDGSAKWYDYGGAGGQPIGAGITIGSSSAFGGRKVAAFAAGAYVSCGPVMPVDADYTIVAVFKRNVTAGDMAITGGGYSVDSSRPWHELRIQADGHVLVSHRGAPVSDPAAQISLTAAHVLSVSWSNIDGRCRLTRNGAQLGADRLSPSRSNTQGECDIGRLPGFPGFDFAGQIAEFILFGEDLVGADLAAIHATLMSDYGLA